MDNLDHSFLKYNVIIWTKIIFTKKLFIKSGIRRDDHGPGSSENVRVRGFQWRGRQIAQLIFNAQSRNGYLINLFSAFENFTF